MIPGRIFVDNKLTAEMVFFCKDCRKLVETTPVGKKFVYLCNVCKSKNVAFGTLKSIKNFYRVADGAPGDGSAPLISEAEKKAMDADKL